MSLAIRIAAVGVALACTAPHALGDRPGERVRGPVIPPGSRIAVVSTDSTGGSQVDRVLGEMLVTALQKAGARVVERQALDAILREQRLARDGVVDPATAAPAGRALGAQYLLAVRATEFGVRDSDIGGIVGIGGPVGGVQIRTSTARVVLDARLIDVASSAVTLTATAEGKQATTGGTLLGGRIAGRSINLGGIDIRNREWSESSLGKAARKAVDDLVTRIAGQPAPGEGAVLASLPDGAVIIGVGTQDGVREGDLLEVYSLDPVRNSKGEVVWSEERTVGQARIVEARPDRSRAVPVTGTTGLAEGMRVRLKRILR